MVIALAGAAPRVVRWVRRRRSRIESATRIERRLELKANVERNLPPPNQYGNRGEAIIRDVHRADRYPGDANRLKRPWSWFGVELKDTYHRGIEVFIKIGEVVVDEQRRTWRPAIRGEEPSLTAYIVGRIPFDWIAQIDWTGDEYYPQPHIYCRFIGKRREPWEEIVLYYRKADSDFLWSADDYKAIGDPLGIPKLAIRWRIRGLFNREQ
jgi:hypothetical protein